VRPGEPQSYLGRKNGTRKTVSLQKIAARSEPEAETKTWDDEEAGMTNEGRCFLGYVGTPSILKSNSVGTIAAEHHVVHRRIATRLAGIFVIEAWEF